MVRKYSLKRALGLGLALVVAGLGLNVPKVSALNSGSLTCDALKSTLRSDNSETGESIMVLSEDCSDANLYINPDQKITLDTAGHILSSNSGDTITVEYGGELVITNYSEIGTIRGNSVVINNSGKVEIKKGNIVGNIVEPSSAENAETIITGGTFSVDPSDYIADGYEVTQQGGVYIVELESGEEEGEEDENLFDTSKVVASNDNIKAALVETLNSYISDPDTSSLNGRMLAQLVNSIEQGHTISATVTINDNPELSEEVLQLLLDRSSGSNLASVYDVKFVVTDTSDPSLSVSLAELMAPVTITLPIPTQYKAELAKRTIGIINVHEDQGQYIADDIDDASISTSGDVTFETSMFSLFALTYEGDPITVDSDAYYDDSGSSVPQTGDTSATGSAEGDVVVPNTAGFDNVELSVFHLLMLTGISLVIIALFAYGIRRVYTRSRISLK